jgi:hypothetical protein
MANIAQSWVNARRADSIALLLFSKVPGCYPAKADPTSPFDFLLSFLPGGKHAVAVEVKGVREQPHRTFNLSYSRGDAVAIDRLEVPLFLLVIHIASERVFYGWIRPPSTTASLATSVATSGSIEVPITELRPGELERVIKVKNTKQYTVRHSKGTFRMFVSEHFDGSFFSTVLYYSKSRSHGESATRLTFAHRNFKGRSADEAYSKCLRWIDANLGSGYSVTETDGHLHQ